jgi:hypothetical protein
LNTFQLVLWHLALDDRACRVLNTLFIAIFQRSTVFIDILTDVFGSEREKKNNTTIANNTYGRPRAKSLIASEIAATGNTSKKTSKMTGIKAGQAASFCI